MMDWSAEQIEYVETVLGASSDYFRFVAAVPQSAAAVAQPWVLTPVLSDAEHALLQKILASVKLTTYEHREGESLALPERGHVIRFGADDFGRFAEGERVDWRLPALRDMLGAGVTVIEKKKITWNLLQQFTREFG